MSKRREISAKSRGAHMRYERRSRVLAQKYHSRAEDILTEAGTILNRWLMDESVALELWTKFSARMRQYKRVYRRAIRMDAKAEYHTKKQIISTEAD